MTSSPPPLDRNAARLRAAEESLHRVRAHAAALEELSEQLSLSVHVLEAEIGGLGEQMRSDAERLQAHATQQPADVGGARPADEPTHTPRSTDPDGARLVALDMALDGEPREVADRYLQEHFDVPERERLLDEVYAAAGR